MLPPTKSNKIRALSDIWVFADLIDFKGGRKQFSQIHWELGNFVAQADQYSGSVHASGGLVADQEQVTRLLILMPRGHLKSTVASVLYVLWRIYRNPNIRIVVGTNVKELSWAFIRELRSYLEDETLKKTVWNSRPHVIGALIPELDRSGRRGTASNTDATDKKVIWSATALQVVRPKKMKEPTIQATSVGSRLTGGHFDLLILDDVVDFKNTASPDIIKKVFEWAQDLESVLDPRRVEKVHDIAAVPFYDQVGDQIVVLGTRYDRLDYYGYILDNLDELEYKVMSRNIYKNGKNKDDGYLWAERFNDRVIEKLRKRLTGRRFASQYLNTIIVEAEQPLNPELVRYYSPQLVDIKETEVTILENVPGKPNPRIRPYVVVDPAISERKSADNTSIAVGGFDQYGELWVLEQQVGKFRPSKTAEILLEMVNRWKLKQVYIEQVGGFKAIGYTVQEHFKSKQAWVRVNEYKPGQAKKKTRIENYLEPLFKGASVHLPYYLKTNSIVQDEIQFFPNETVTDDVLDSWSMLVEIARPPMTQEQKKVNQGRPPRAFRNTRYGGTR